MVNFFLWDDTPTKFDPNGEAKISEAKGWQIKKALRLLGEETCLTFREVFEEAEGTTSRER